MDTTILARIPPFGPSKRRCCRRLVGMDFRLGSRSIHLPDRSGVTKSILTGLANVMEQGEEERAGFFESLIDMSLAPESSSYIVPVAFVIGIPFALFWFVSEYGVSWAGGTGLVVLIIGSILGYRLIVELFKLLFNWGPVFD